MTTTFKEFFNELKESTFCDADILNDIKLTPEQFFLLARQCLESRKNLNVFLYLLKNYPINIDNINIYEKLLIQSVTSCSKLYTEKNTDISNRFKCLALLIKGSEKYINSFKYGKLFDYLYFENLLDIEILEFFKCCDFNFLQIKNEYALCYIAQEKREVEILTSWIKVIGLPESEHLLFFKRFVRYVFNSQLKKNNIELINFINLLESNNYLPNNLYEIVSILIENFNEEKINDTLFVYCIEVFFRNKDVSTLKNSDAGYKLLSTKNSVLIAHLGRYDLNWNKEDATGDTSFDLFETEDLINKVVNLNPLVLKVLRKEKVSCLEFGLGQSLIHSCFSITESLKNYMNSQMAYNFVVDTGNQLEEKYINLISEKDLNIIKKLTNPNNLDFIMASFSEFCIRNNLRLNEEKITNARTYLDVVLSIDKELSKKFHQIYLPLSSPLMLSFINWSKKYDSDVLVEMYKEIPQVVCEDLELLVKFYTKKEIDDEMTEVEHWEDGKLLIEKYKSEIDTTKVVSYDTFRKLFHSEKIEKKDKKIINNLFDNHHESIYFPIASKAKPVEKNKEIKDQIEVVDESFITQELFSEKGKNNFIDEYKTETERKEIRNLVFKFSQNNDFNKRFLAKSNNLFTQIENLYYNFPHFEKVIQHLENHCHLQKAGNGVFYIPPLLFAGGPGVGKTFFAHQLSMFVKTNFHMFNMESMTAGWILMGLNGSWNGSATGKVFDILMKKEIMNPIFLLDEIDKCPKGSYSAENALLSLLEQYTAKNFRDECVPLPIDASNIIWFATANNLQSISAPIKSRFDIFNIPNPNTQQKKALISNIYSSVLSSNSWGVNFSGNLPSATLDILSQTMTPGAARDLRKIITTGCSKAIRAGRDELHIEDLEKFEQPIPKPWDMMAIEAT